MSGFVEKREWEVRVFVGPANSPALPRFVGGPTFEYRDTGSPDFKQIDPPADFRVVNADYTEQTERERDEYRREAVEAHGREMQAVADCRAGLDLAETVAAYSRGDNPSIERIIKKAMEVHERLAKYSNQEGRSDG